MANKLSESIERAFPTAKFDATKATTDQAGTAGASDATQLEPVIVKEDKLPKLKERDVLKMSEAEKEQQRRHELAELSSVLHAAGAKAPPGVQRKIDEAMTRDNGWLNSPPGTPFREIK